MNANAELLNFVYQNSGMGVDTLNQLLDIVEGDDFRKQIESQLKGYRDFNEKAKAMLHENGYNEKDISAFQKITSNVMINVKTLTDKSNSHIAEMMLTGSNMGIIDAIKSIKKYEHDAEKDIVSLMNKLLDFEEKNVEKLKEFL